MWDFEQGEVLAFDKPLHWTSFDLVAKVRAKLCHTLGKKKLKVGHSGTLDPLATGVVIICTGKKTKLIEQLQNSPNIAPGSGEKKSFFHNLFGI